jgi:hypothetical protein
MYFDLSESRRCVHKSRLALTTIWFCAVVFAVSQLQSCKRPQTELNASIPRAKQELYKDYHDASEWLNPALQVCSRDEVTLIVLSITKERRVVAKNDLRRTLVALPVAAWPYGRVIAVQDCSISTRDDARTRNIDDVLVMVKDLGLEIEQWPP